MLVMAVDDVGRCGKTLGDGGRTHSGDGAVS